MKQKQLDRIKRNKKIIENSKNRLDYIQYEEDGVPYYSHGYSYKDTKKLEDKQNRMKAYVDNVDFTKKMPW